jgi:pimeloyl-ACP methyl ester carboxylesterase
MIRWKHLNKWQRLALRLLGYYCAICLGAYLLQDRLIYYPNRMTAAQAQTVFAQANLTPWPTAAEYRAVWRPPAEDTSLTNGTVLVFHGNAGGAQDRAWYCDTLQQLGWRVILAEYPGYAARGGKLGEASFREDGRETARLVREQFSGPLIIFGESLGCAVAASVAADPGLHADAVVLATPWATLQTVAGHHYPWLPTRLFLRDRYDSAAYLKNYAGPVTLLMAEADRVIPRASTLALHAAFPCSRLMTVPDAGHNDWFWRMMDVQWCEILTKGQL